MATTTTSGRIAFSCPNCGKRSAAPAGAVGKKGRCPKCRDPIEIPAPDERFLEAPDLEVEADDPDAAEQTLDAVAGNVGKVAQARARCSPRVSIRNRRRVIVAVDRVAASTSSGSERNRSRPDGVALTRIRP